MTLDDLDLWRARDVAKQEYGDWRDLDDYSKDVCLSIVRAIRKGDEARGLCVVPVDGLNQVRAVLAQYLTAGHNFTGPAHEDVDKTFWLVDAWLAEPPEAKE